MNNPELIAFAHKVRQMRAAQERLRHAKTKQNFAVAIKLQDEVDRMVTTIPEPPRANPNQPSLFGMSYAELAR